MCSLRCTIDSCVCLLYVVVKYNNTTALGPGWYCYSPRAQGRSQDVSLRGVSVRAKRACYAGTFVGERSESVTPAAGKKFLGLTACKTSRCNLAIEISFVPSFQSTFNFMNSQFYLLQKRDSCKKRMAKNGESFYGEFGFDHLRNSPFFATDTPRTCTFLYFRQCMYVIPAPSSF